MNFICTFGFFVVILQAKLMTTLLDNSIIVSNNERRSYLFAQKGETLSHLY